MEMQTIWTVMRHRKNQDDSEISEEAGANEKRPMVLNTCHAWSTESPVVKENAPKYYTGPDRIEAVDID